MKNIYKMMMIVLGIVVAAEYFMGKMDWRTKRKMQKKARKFQHMAEDIVGQLKISWL